MQALKNLISLSTNQEEKEVLKLQINSLKSVILQLITSESRTK